MTQQPTTKTFYSFADIQAAYPLMKGFILASDATTQFGELIEYKNESWLVLLPDNKAVEVEKVASLSAYQQSLIEPAIVAFLARSKEPKTATEIGQMLDKIDHRATSSKWIEHLFSMDSVRIHKCSECIRFSLK